MLKIGVRATNEALNADILDYVWVEESWTIFALKQLIQDEVYDWMRDYCDDKDDEQYIEESNIQIISVTEE